MYAVVCAEDRREEESVDKKRVLYFDAFVIAWRSAQSARVIPKLLFFLYL